MKLVHTLLSVSLRKVGFQRNLLHLSSPWPVLCTIGLLQEASLLHAWLVRISPLIYGAQSQISTNSARAHNCGVSRKLSSLGIWVILRLYENLIPVIGLPNITVMRPVLTHETWSQQTKSLESEQPKSCKCIHLFLDFLGQRGRNGTDAMPEPGKRCPIFEFGSSLSNYRRIPLCSVSSSRMRYSSQRDMTDNVRAASI
jgi:hypothetical protein